MLTRLGGQGSGALLNTYRLYTDGLIDRHTFLAVSSELMQHINTQGRAYGRLSYESASSVIADREPLAERGEIPHVDNPNTSTVKIQQSLETILDGDQDQIEQRLERLGTTLPIDETQAGYASQLQADDLATGWTRLLDAEGCELCEWWARDGRTWPKRHPMPRHKGCKCQQLPVYHEAASSTEYTRKLERREQAIANRELTEQGELER